MTPDLEATLWAPTPGTDRDWSVIIPYLISRLSSYLGHEATLASVLLREDDAFCCAIEGRIALGGAFSIEWTGRLGMQPIEGGRHVSATLFLFSRKRRLQLEGHSGSMLELQFEPREHGAGEWVSHGWHEDLYGEWEGAEPPRSAAVNDSIDALEARARRRASLLVS
jgi:hypothetical protein